MEKISARRPRQTLYQVQEKFQSFCFENCNGFYNSEHERGPPEANSKHPMVCGVSPVTPTVCEIGPTRNYQLQANVRPGTKRAWK
jgi:hypothetical protein